MNSYNSFVKQISTSDCDEWTTEIDHIRHRSGRYFSIICIRHNSSEVIMIDQPEIGILGFIATLNSTKREWLIQNKPEPGNVKHHQIAPSVQATKSNYERAHGGKDTNFLHYFTDKNKHLIDVQGSEQGTKFLNKFNRNIKVLVKKTFEPENSKTYHWLESEQLKLKLRESFVINTDARSVLTSGYWHLLSEGGHNCFTYSELLSKKVSLALHQSYLLIRKKQIVRSKNLLTIMGKKYQRYFEVIKFNDMQSFQLSDNGIINLERNPVINYFDVSFPDREVPCWQQPLMMQQKKEHSVLIFSIVDGLAYFYLCAYPEIGFINRVELGPSLQTGGDVFKSTEEEAETFLSHHNINILSSIEQSDEGGRFYENISRYTLVYWLGSQKTLSRKNGIWLSAGEIEFLSRSKGMLTNELRTLLSILISYI